MPDRNRECNGDVRLTGNSFAAIDGVRYLDLMPPKTRRTVILTLAGVLCTLLVLAMYVIPVLPFLRLELLSQDIRAQLGRKTPINTNLVFLGLDQPGYPDLFGEDEIRASPLLGQMATYPLPRTVWAGVVERLVNAGADVVALDFVFSGPREEDDELRRVLQAHSNRVVLAANFADADFSRETTDVALLTPDPKILGDANPRTDPRVGFINVWEDRDGVIRSARFQMTRESTGGMLPSGEVVHSFATRIVERVSPTKRLPADAAPRVIRFSAPPQRGYPMRPLYTIFLKSHWEQNFNNGAFFRGKVVVVGPAANIMQDFHLVPLAAVSRDEKTGERVSNSSMPGPEIHLNIVAAALAGELIREISPQAGAVLTAAGALISLILASAFRGPFRRLLIAILVGCGFLIVAQLFFDRWNHVVYVVGPVVTFGATTLIGFGYDFLLLRIEKNRTRRTLERYVSKDVVHEILDNPETYLNTLGGVRKPVTILFSDVRGFTTMTEGADPAQLVLQLNEYFKEMVDIVFAQHGSLDKFIGDAVMALWGSITSQGIERDAQNAVTAALAMRKSLARLNLNWKQRGITELSFGIGVNHGDAIVGNLGSEQKMEVSVIGDPVNIASRLEGLTKEYKLDLLLGESMVPLVQDRFVLRTVGSVQMKGKTKPVRVYTVVADIEAGEQAPSWLARYEQGIELYRGRKFEEGANAFSECLREQPRDPLCQLYLEHCRELMAHPPGLEWDTVLIMKSK